MKRKDTLAVHEDDLETLLESLGVLNNILAKKVKCFFCKNIITLDNFLCVFPYKKKINFCCDNLKCYEEVLEHRREKQ